MLVIYFGNLLPLRWMSYPCCNGMNPRDVVRAGYPEKGPAHADTTVKCISLAG